MNTGLSASQPMPVTITLMVPLWLFLSLSPDFQSSLRPTGPSLNLLLVFQTGLICSFQVLRSREALAGWLS